MIELKHFFHLTGYEYVIKKKDFHMKGVKHDPVVIGERKGKVSANHFLLHQARQDAK